MASRWAAWVLGGVRLISSASTMLSNTGPGRKVNLRLPVSGSSWRMSVPVMSAGIRSGVNWMRLKERARIFETVLTRSVLARPGTPTSRQWPRLNSAISNCSTTCFWPTMTLPIWSVMRSWAAARSRTALASSGSGVAGWGIGALGGAKRVAGFHSNGAGGGYNRPPPANPKTLVVIRRPVVPRFSGQVGVLADLAAADGQDQGQVEQVVDQADDQGHEGHDAHLRELLGVPLLDRPVQGQGH